MPGALRVAGRVNKDGKNSAYSVNIGALPEKVSGWNESYYKSAGDEYTRSTTMTKNDLIVKTRFRNMRWEGGEYVQRSKPYIAEKYVNPETVKGSGGIKRAMNVMATWK